MVSNQRKKQKVLAENILSLGSTSGHVHQNEAWSRPHKLSESSAELTPLQQWQEFNRIQKHTRSLGSNNEGRYVTTQLVANPPAPQDVTLELLMASQTHMGHNTSLWNPSNSRYIYGVREGIHIISLEVTAAHLRRAARVVEEVAFRGGLILFVGTRKGQMEIVTKAAELAEGCHVFNKWTPGAITNRDVILQSARSRVVGHNDQPLEDFEVYTSSARPLMPDLVVCLNPKENYTLLAECGQKDIPTIGVIDTDADPTWVTYTIPANDDSLRSIGVIAGALGRAGQSGQAKRRNTSKGGDVPWATTPQVSRHMNTEITKAETKRAKLLETISPNTQGFNEEEQAILAGQHSHEQVSMSEDEMIGLLGEAAMPAATPVKQAAGSESAQLHPIVSEIEAQLAGVSSVLSKVEQHVKKTKLS